eukprot:7587764-Pyramimonas_sp.AAC.1
MPCARRSGRRTGPCEASEELGFGQVARWKGRKERFVGVGREVIGTRCETHGNKEEDALMVYYVGSVVVRLGSWAPRQIR